MRLPVSNPVERWHLLSRGLHQPWSEKTGSGGATPSSLQASSSSTSLLSPPSSSAAVKHGPCLLILKKRVQAFKTMCMRKLLCISYLEHKTNYRVQSKINFLVSPQEALLATFKRQKPAWFRHVTRHDILSKSSSWRVDNAMVGQGNAGWITSKSGCICPCQSCSQGSRAEKTGRGSLLNHPSCPLSPTSPR